MQYFHGFCVPLKVIELLRKPVFPFIELSFDMYQQCTLYIEQEIYEQSIFTVHLGLFALLWPYVH